MIRTTIIPHSKTIQFDVPVNYIGKELEIIAFEKGEGIKQEREVSKEVSFKTLSIDTKAFSFNREEVNER